LGLLALASVVTGCAMVGPDYVKPTAPEPREWLEPVKASQTVPPAESGMWWHVFNDPILDALVETAYRQNLSLQVAGIRILESRAQLGIALGSQYPQRQLALGEAKAEKTSKNVVNAATLERFSETYSVGFDVAWELDFWGKFRRGVQSGVAGVQALIADYDVNLVLLTSEVARTYLSLRTSEQRLAVARVNVDIQKRSFELASIQHKAGAVTQLDVFQARALLKSTEATIPQLESDIRQAKNALATLMGRLPGAIDTLLGPPGRIPQVPAAAAVGAPAELLRRRPDIRTAERRLAAQSAQIGVAKADLFPHFS
jgi:NodT family efflux transporter outer membrane factor (OMF) lipoprotein